MLHDKMTSKKHLFPEALRNSLGIVSTACKMVGIARNTYYSWRKQDLEFAAECDNVEEHTMDFVESKLLELIEEKNPSAIIFYCKTKGRNRGYIERVEHGGINSDAIKHNIELSGEVAAAFDRSLARRDSKIIAEYKATQDA